MLARLHQSSDTERGAIKRFWQCFATAVLAGVLVVGMPSSAQATSYTYFAGSINNGSWTGTTKGLTIYTGSSTTSPEGTLAWVYVTNIGIGSGNGWMKMTFAPRSLNTSCRFTYPVTGSLGVAYITCRLYYYE